MGFIYIGIELSILTLEILIMIIITMRPSKLSKKVIKFFFKNVSILFCDCKTWKKSELVVRKLMFSAFQLI